MISEKGIGGTLEHLIDKIIKAIPGAIDKIVAFIDKNGSKIIDKIVDIVSGLLQAIIPKLPAIFNSLLELAIELVSRLSEEIPVLLPMVVDAVIKLIEGLVAHLPEILEALGKVFLGIMGGLESIAGGDGEAFYKAFVGGIENGYTGDEDFWTRMSQYYENHKSVFSEIGTTLGDWLYENFTKEFFDRMEHFDWNHPIESFLKNAWETCVQKRLRWLDIGKGIIDWIVQGITSIDWETIVNNLIEGLKRKVTNKSSIISNIGFGMGGLIFGGVTSALGIHSPSKKFEWIAEMSIQGYEDGINDAKDKLSDSLNGIFGLSPNMITNASANLSPNIVVNNVNNISMKQDPLGQMVNDIKNFSGGAKNDYNYGQV